MAADAGLFQLMELIIQVHPQSIQELWVQKKEWPLAIVNMVCKHFPTQLVFGTLVTCNYNMTLLYGSSHGYAIHSPIYNHPHYH